MGYRQVEIKGLKLDGRWLNETHAQNAYEFAAMYCSSNRYGLETDRVIDIERFVIESDTVAQHWLSKKLDNSGTVQIVFSRKDVLVISTKLFLFNWRAMFMPARDDVVVIHNLNKQIAYYCHEDEWEVGQRIS